MTINALDTGGLSTAEWSALAVIAAAAIAVLGTWITARVTKSNAATTARVQADANAVEGFRALTERLEASIDRMQKDQERMQGEINQLRADLETERRGTADLRDALDGAVDYIDELTSTIAAVNPQAAIPTPPPILAKLRQNYRRRRT